MRAKTLLLGFFTYYSHYNEVFIIYNYSTGKLGEFYFSKGSQDQEIVCFD